MMQRPSGQQLPRTASRMLHYWLFLILSTNSTSWLIVFRLKETIIEIGIGSDLFTMDRRDNYFGVLVLLLTKC